MNKRIRNKSSFHKDRHRRWILTFPNQKYWHEQRKSLATFLDKPITKLTSQASEEDGPIEVVYQWNKGLKADYVKQKLGDDNIGIRRNTFKGRPGIRPNSPSPSKNVNDVDILSTDIDIKIEDEEEETLAKFAGAATTLDCARKSTTTRIPSLNASSISAWSDATPSGISHDDSKEVLNTIDNQNKTNASTNLDDQRIDTVVEENQACQINTPDTDELTFQTWVSALEQGASLEEIKKNAATLNKTKLFFDRKKILETVIIDLNTQKYIKGSLLPRYKQILEGRRQTLQTQSQDCLDLLLEEQLSKGNSYIFNVLYENREHLS